VAAAASDAGAVRALNEDAVLAASPIFLVADGMGGHAAGEVAAGIAVAELGKLAGTTDLGPDQLLDAIDAANRAILDWSASRPDTAGMGTTLSGVALGRVGGSPHWFVFNVGDSRVYRFDGAALTQVTTDHSEMEELIRAGAITAEQARHHPRRNVVTRSLGTDPAPIADIWVLPAEPGDTFLICSDGLTLEVDDVDMSAVLRAAREPADAAAALVARAIAAGARDNVSAVVVSLPRVAEQTTADVATAPRHRLPDADS